MDADPSGQHVALPCSPARRIRTVLRIRRALKWVLLLKPGQRVMEDLNELVQVLNRIDLARLAIARLGQAKHAAELEHALQALEPLLAEGPEHTRLLQALLDASLRPILQASHARVSDCTAGAAQLASQAASRGRWAVIQATSTAVFAASTWQALSANHWRSWQERPAFADVAPPSTAGVICVAGGAVGLWAASSGASRRLASDREAAERLQGEAALVAVAQASLVEDWMELEGALLVAFIQEVQGGLLALQGELLRGRLDNVHEPCVQLGRSVSALQHTLALLTGPV